MRFKTASLIISPGIASLVPMLLGLAVVGCGSKDGEDAPAPASTPTPTPRMPVTKAMRDRFMASCQSTKSNSPEAAAFRTLVRFAPEVKSCAQAFDFVVKSREARIGCDFVKGCAWILELVPFVETITLSNDVAAHIGKLDAFTNLTDVRIVDADLTDVAFLLKKPFLKKVWIVGSPIAQVKPLARIESLERLYLSNLAKDGTGPLTVTRTEKDCPTDTANAAFNAGCRDYQEERAN